MSMVQGICKEKYNLILISRKEGKEINSYILVREKTAPR